MQLQAEDGANEYRDNTPRDIAANPAETERWNIARERDNAIRQFRQTRRLDKEKTATAAGAG